MASKVVYGSAVQIAEAQKTAQATSNRIQKATKAIVLILSGFSAVFLLKLLNILLKKKSGKLSESEASTQINSLRSQTVSKFSSAIQDSWTKGTTLGLKAAKEQRSSSTSSKTSDSSTMQSIIKDTEKTIDDAISQLSSLVDSSDTPDPSKINKAITLRLQMSGEAALKYAIADTMESELTSPDTRKMWVSTNPTTACSHCTRLNGMIRDWGEEFPHNFIGIHKLKVYGGILLSPLRHPNCRCILVAVPKES